MKKSILTIKTPMDCGHCPLSKVEADWIYCLPQNEKLCDSDKPIWCPLKEIDDEVVESESGLSEDYPKLKRGDEFWYVDFENHLVERGEVMSVVWDDGHVKSFGVDFPEEGDADEFYGDALGKYFFKYKGDAYAALRNGR